VPRASRCTHAQNSGTCTRCYDRTREIGGDASSRTSDYSKERARGTKLDVVLSSISRIKKENFRIFWLGSPLKSTQNSMRTNKHNFILRTGNAIVAGEAPSNSGFKWGIECFLTLIAPWSAQVRDMDNEREARFIGH